MRDLMLAAIGFCPHQLVESVFYEKVIGELLKLEGDLKVEVLEKIAIHNKIEFVPSNNKEVL